ncbi:MAG TPA: hypothetical protein VKI45_10385, partial [Allosphingosinicella sp.]|nr:hypothetical protein [Allosphingosinicella sp.]
MTLIAALCRWDGAPAKGLAAKMLRAQRPATWSEEVWSDGGGTALALAVPQPSEAAPLRPPIEGASGTYAIAADLRLDNREDFLPQLGIGAREAEAQVCDARLA